MTVLNKSAFVNPQLLECAITAQPLELHEVVYLPDMSGDVQPCSAAAALSERFFDTLETRATDVLLSLLADVPLALQSHILDTLKHAVTGAQMRLADWPPSKRHAALTVAISEDPDFGARLKNFGVMPDPRAAVTPDGLYLEMPEFEPLEPQGNAAVYV